jgi:hypothetical protein
MIAVMSAGACLLAVSKPSLSLAAYMPAVQQLLGFDKLTTNRLNQQAASSLLVLKKVLKSSGFSRFSIAIIRKIAIVLYLLQACSQKYRKVFLKFHFHI